MRRLNTLVVLSLVSTFTASAAFAQGAPEKPRYGGTFVAAIAGEPGGLNPVIWQGAEPQISTAPIFDTLIKLDKNANPVGHLADSWDVSGDRTTITFRLRKDVRWHDGKPLTSADVVWTFLGSRAGYMVHPRYKSALDSLVDSYGTPDASTFVIKLKSPYAPFLKLFASSNYAMPIVPKHVYDGTDVSKNRANWNPIGTGPFKFKEWVKGSHIELVKNDNYFIKGLPRIDKFVVRFMPDETARLLALQKGEVDYLYYYAVPYNAIPALKANSNIVVTDEGAGLQGLVQMWYFNLQKPPFDNLKVRQAFAYLLDRNAINKLVYYDLARPTNTVLGKTTPFSREDVQKKYDLGSAEQNVATANKLLDEAGYPRKADGTRFTTTLLYMNGRPYAGKIGEIYADRLKKVGVGLTMSPMDRAAFIERTHSKWDYTISEQQLSSSAHPYIGIPRYLQWSAHKAGLYPSNATGYNNPKIEQLFGQSTTAASDKQEAQIWSEVQKILSEDLPVLPIVEMPYTNVHRSEWKEVFSSIDGVFDVSRTVWSTKGRANP